MKAGYRRRFSRTERTLHWANAVFFFFLLATGLILYLPSLSVLVGRRPLMQSLHFWSGIVWVVVLALIVLGGDRRGVARTAGEIDGFDGDDWRWLTGRKPAPQGRFNAGQKLNTILTAAFLVLFLVSGLLLWFGERNTQPALREHGRAPRRADVRLARAPDRPPLSRRDPPGNPACAARDHGRLGQRGLGGTAPREVEARVAAP